MCSINECACEVVNDRPVIRKNESSESEGICKKCRSEDIEVALKAAGGGYCKSCFLTRTSHKFRATLGKSKIIRKDDSVLVFHDGSAGSTALLHLIKSGQDESARKKLLMEPIVLYVDENVLDNHSTVHRRSSMESAIEQIRKLGFSAYTTSLASFSGEAVPLHAVNDAWEATLSDADEAASKAFHSLTDRSAKEDLATSLRRRLLVTAARQLGCNRVLLPDISIDIAVKLLSDLALGRGTQLSFDVDFIDARYSDVMFLRPMKDFTAEEVEHYLTYCNISSVPDIRSVEEESSVATNSAATLQTLTKNFVMKLDDEFSGTVSTIFRTGGKLSGEVMTEDGNARDVCRLCNGMLEADSAAPSNDDKLFAIRATDFSKLVSSTLKMNCNTDGDGGTDRMFEDVDDSTVPVLTEESPRKSLQRTLCYGCRLILYNFDDCSDILTLMPHLKQ